MFRFVKLNVTKEIGEEFLPQIIPMENTYTTNPLSHQNMN